MLFRGQASISKSPLKLLFCIPYGAKLTFLNCLSSLVCSFPPPTLGIWISCSERGKADGTYAEFGKTRKIQLMGCWQANSTVHILLPHIFCLCIHTHAYDFFYLLKRGSHFRNKRMFLNRIQYMLCPSSLI